MAGRLPTSSRTQERHEAAAQNPISSLSSSLRLGGSTFSPTDPEGFSSRGGSTGPPPNRRHSPSRMMKSGRYFLNCLLCSFEPSVTTGHIVSCLSALIHSMRERKLLAAACCPLVLFIEVQSNASRSRNRYTAAAIDQGACRVIPSAPSSQVSSG